MHSDPSVREGADENRFEDVFPFRIPSLKLPKIQYSSSTLKSDGRQTELIK